MPLTRNWIRHWWCQMTNLQKSRVWRSDVHIAGHLAPLQGEKWDGVDVSRRSLGEGGSRPSLVYRFLNPFGFAAFRSHALASEKNRVLFEENNANAFFLRL